MAQFHDDGSIVADDAHFHRRLEALPRPFLRQNDGVGTRHGAGARRLADGRPGTYGSIFGIFYGLVLMHDDLCKVVDRDGVRVQGTPGKPS